jgi:hypothetical protein
MKIAPPEGISENDYEAIEAAVMETVRGRWFLAEFSRRSHVAEMRQVLDALARLEQIVSEQRVLPADPSIRLLIQRLKDVAQQLDCLVMELRLQGENEALCARVETQARAVGSLLQLNVAFGALGSAAAPEAEHAAVGILPQEPAVPPLPPMASLPPRPAAATGLTAAARKDAGQDGRLAGLARLDGLPIAAKLALFR